MPRCVIKLRKQRCDSKINRTTNRMREILLQYFLNQYIIVFPNILFFFHHSSCPKTWNTEQGETNYFFIQVTHITVNKKGEKKKEKKKKKGEKKMKKKMKKNEKKMKKEENETRYGTEYSRVVKMAILSHAHDEGEYGFLHLAVFHYRVSARWKGC